MPSYILEVTDMEAVEISYSKPPDEMLRVIVMLAPLIGCLAIQFHVSRLDRLCNNRHSLLH